MAVIGCCVRSRPADPRSATPALARRLLAVFAACALVSGCGGSGPKLAPVSGKVSKGGSPVAGVKVEFSPSGQGKTSPGPGSMGITDAQGKYTLKTNETPPRTGAVPGKHAVVLTADQGRAPDDDSIAPAKSEQIAAKFRDGSQTFEVPAGGTDKADFDISQ